MDGMIFIEDFCSKNCPFLTLTSDFNIMKGILDKIDREKAGFVFQLQTTNLRSCRINEEETNWCLHGFVKITAFRCLWRGKSILIFQPTCSSISINCCKGVYASFCYISSECAVNRIWFYPTESETFVTQKTFDEMTIMWK